MTCPRCAGLMISRYSEIRCLICGHYIFEDIQQPIVPQPNRQWTPGICEFCGKSAIRAKRLCRGCYMKERDLIQAVHGRGA